MLMSSAHGDRTFSTAEVVKDEAGEWTESAPSDGTEQLLRRLEAVLYQQGYEPAEVERVYWAVRERVDPLNTGVPSGRVGFRVDGQQVIIRLDGAAPDSAEMRQFGMLTRAGLMEWYCYERQGAALLLRDYRVVA
jgi:hypothetical protein